MSALLDKPPGPGASICKQTETERLLMRRCSKTFKMVRHAVAYTTPALRLVDNRRPCRTNLHDAVRRDAEHTWAIKAQWEQWHLHQNTIGP